MAHSKAILMNRFYLIKKIRPKGKTNLPLGRALANAAVIIMLGIILAGCSLKGIQPLKAEKSQSLLKQAEQSFLDKDYQTSRRIYQSILKARPRSEIKSAARCGLAWTDMAEANEPKAFQDALAFFMQPDMKAERLNVNPQILARVLTHGLTLMDTRQKKSEAKIVELHHMEKKYKTAHQQMQHLIDTLRHQISVLESIEQERREKRKTQ